MILRVNINTEYEAQSFLVETEDIEDDTVREVVEFVANNPEGTKKFNSFLKTVNGKIIQQGYAINEEMRNAQIQKPNNTVYVDTVV